MKKLSLKTLSEDEMETIQAGSGQGAMDCFVDAYSHHGYVSLWLSVQTCFLPWTAAYIGAACVGKNI